MLFVQNKNFNLPFSGGQPFLNLPLHGERCHCSCSLLIQTSQTYSLALLQKTASFSPLALQFPSSCSATLVLGSQSFLTRSQQGTVSQRWSVPCLSAESCHSTSYPGSRFRPKQTLNCDTFSIMQLET